VKRQGAGHKQRMDIPADWTASDDGAALLRTFRFKNFAAAFAFLTRVAAHAEAVDHHPEFTSVWNRVDFRLTSHDAGAVTARDVELARAIDRLAASTP
jgi:4a-hydroxytetrahydrobiopterin dehydratase